MTSSRIEDESGGVLTIDLPAIVANWKFLASQAPRSECAAVVKADAYGIQINEVCPALARAGCKTFFTAYLSEAEQVRQLLPDVAIYVLNGLFPNTCESYKKWKIYPVLGSVSQCAEWEASSGKDLGAALHVDTGINRIGFRTDEFERWLDDHRGTPPFKVNLIMSHFACAYTPTHPLNLKQIEAFKTVRQRLPDIRASLSNSSGIFLSPEAHHDLVRPGYALYGGNPIPGQPNPMRPVITLKGRVIAVRSVFPGESIGYGGAFPVQRPMRIATISLGYADGLFRSLGTLLKRPAEVIAAGQRCRLLGGVSMDMFLIDVTHIPPTELERGDFVEVIGPQIGVDVLADLSGTIGYEILTSLRQRYIRHYIRN